jgi:oligopeptide transport system substrate-binding protein
MTRGLAGLGLALAVAAALLAFTFRAALPGRAEFAFANGSEPKTLDPGRATGEPEGRIVDALFEGLTARDPATLRPAPGVAESWSISEDGRRYEFRLRPDARWSDGRPVTAQDFAWSWRRLLEPAHGAEYAYLLHGLRHAEALHGSRARARRLREETLPAFDALAAAHAGAFPAPAWRQLVAQHDLVAALAQVGEPVVRAALASDSGPAPAERARFRAALLVEADAHEARAAAAETHFGVDQGAFALDERRFVVELLAPIPYFLDLTAFYPTFPVPRALVEAHPDAWFLPGRIVGNGAFVLEAWRVGDRIRLARSPTYWNRDAVALARVDALPIENPVTALNLYLSGALDWLPRTPGDLAETLRERPDHYGAPALVVYYYRVNVTRPPLDDPRVRHALALAIDRETLVRDVLRLGQPAAYHVVPPGIPGYEPPPSALGFDPARARRLLAEAGYPDGRGFPEIGILYNTLEDHRKIAELVADQIRRTLGVRVVPYNQEWQSYLATTQAGDYHLSRAGWIGDYVDPNTFLDLWVTNGGNNQTGWGDPLYDRLIRAAADVEAYAREPFLAGLTEPERVRGLLAAFEAAQGGARPARDRGAARGLSDRGAARRSAGAALRMGLLREAEAILVQRAFPVIPIYFYVTSGLISPRVEGFHAWLADGRPNLQDLHPLRALALRSRTHD